MPFGMVSGVVERMGVLDGVVVVGGEGAVFFPKIIKTPSCMSYSYSVPHQCRFFLDTVYTSVDRDDILETFQHTRCFNLSRSFAVSISFNGAR